jgi:hypothetical protein
MDQKVDSERRLIQYLLGELSEEEQTRLEERFFTDDEYFNHLLVVEDDLIDDYVHDELSQQQRARFESYFLASPQRRQRVEFARALMRTASEAAVAESPSLVTTHPEPTSRRPFWPAFLRFQNPAQRFMMAAVGLVALGGGWLFIETRHLRTQLQQLQTERQSWHGQQQDLQRQIAQQRQRHDALAAQLQHGRDQIARLEQELAQLRPSPLTMLSFVLSPVQSRGVNEPKRLIIPPGAHVLRFQLDIEEGTRYKRYRAVLRRAQGDEIWSQDVPPSRSNAVVLKLPAGILSEGKYQLTLKGSAAKGIFEEVDYYEFVVKREMQ